MRRAGTSKSLISGAVIAAMLLSITGLFGAPGARVQITSPASGAVVSGVIEVRASVSGASVGYIILGVDEARPYSSNSTPCTFELDTTTLTDGAHRLFAEAYDNFGLIASSKAVTIRVKNGQAAPAPAAAPPAARVAAKPAPAAPKAKVAAKPPAKAVAAPAPAEPKQVAAVPQAPAARGPVPEPTPVKVAEARPKAASTPSAEAARERTAPPVMVATAPPVRQVRGHTVVLNGRPVEFDVAPYVSNGRMHAGFRAMFEQAGSVVSWTPETRTARSVAGALTVEVVPGSRVASVNGADVDMGTAMVIQDGRTIVPVRFFARVTGSRLNWDSQTQTASLLLRTRMLAEHRPAD